jgi:hypothetical protein
MAEYKVNPGKGYLTEEEIRNVTRMMDAAGEHNPYAALEKHLGFPREIFEDVYVDPDQAAKMEAQQPNLKGTDWYGLYNQEAATRGAGITPQTRTKIYLKDFLRPTPDESIDFIKSLLNLGPKPDKRPMTNAVKVHEATHALEWLLGMPLEGDHHSRIQIRGRGGRPYLLDPDTQEEMPPHHYLKSPKLLELINR